MNINDAVTVMLNGGKVRRDDWTSNAAIYHLLANAYVLINSNNRNQTELYDSNTNKLINDNWNPILVHFTANDWNVFVSTANT